MEEPSSNHAQEFSGGNPQESLYIIGADNGIRTRDTKLGKLVLYQLSYVRS